MSTKFAITAATGKFGQTAVKELNKLVGADNVVVIARNLEEGKELFPNNEIRHGDYEDLDSMNSALKGIDRVLFISSQPGGKIPRSEAQANVVEAMKNNGVEFVAYTSFPDAQNSKTPLAEDHRNTENKIKEAGLAHSFLRNNWYLENEVVFLQSGAANNPTLYWANNHAGWALEREYAEAAAKVVASDNTQEIYEFAGPARTYEDLGHALQKATGNDFEIKQVSSDEYTEYLEKAGSDHATAAMFASFQAPIDSGALDENSDDLEKVLGHSLMLIEDAIKEILAR